MRSRDFANAKRYRAANIGVGGALSYESIVVPLERESLNTLFETLEGWEHQLKALDGNVPAEMGSELDLRSQGEYRM